MIAAICRLAEPKGEILLKGVQTTVLVLHKLRKIMSIIPQDPLLFKGTLRKNMDPVGEHSDCEIWNALKKV